MVDNDPPTEEEVDEFMELYEEHGTKKAVAERVDWSRPTVSKWIDRRISDMEKQKEQEKAEEPEVSPESEPETPGPAAGGDGQPSGQSTGIAPPIPDDLMKEPEAPNDILLDIMDRDPKLGDDEVAYVKRFFDDYGQLSPSDVTDILSDLSINNKRMTIGRINRHYEKAINSRLREDRDLQYDERWATLLTKVTGDNSYIRRAMEYDNFGGSIGGIQPPAPPRGGETTGRKVGSGIAPPPTNPPSTAGEVGGNGIVPPEPQSSPQGGEMDAQVPRAAPQSGSLDPFQERVLELLEDTLNEKKNTPEPPIQDSKGAAGQIQELVEIQQQIQQLQGMGNSGANEVDAKVEQIRDELSQQLALVQQQIQEQDTQQQVPTPTAGGESSEPSMLSEIAMLSETIDDPDTLKMLIEMQTDPAVLEARAKKEEVETDSQWKTALAESLSPAAAEKAIDALTNITKAAGRAQQQRQQQIQQQPQAQPTQPRQGGQTAQGVQVVQESEPDPDPQPEEDRGPGDESPLRAEAMGEIDADMEDVKGEDVNLEETADAGEVEE